MLGPAPEQRGGVSAVLAVYRDAGLLERRDIELLATHCDGGRIAKLRVALVALGGFARRVLAGRVALAHVHVASNASFWRKLTFCALARLGGVPLVVHVHGGGFAAFHASGGRLRRAAIEACLRHADTVVALSPRWAARLRPLAGATPIVVLPNPLPARALAGAQAAPAAPGDEHLVFLGHLCEAKGIGDLLQAFAAIAHERPAARLTLAGTGDAAAVRAMARASGIERRVALPGWVDGEDKARLLAAATLFVLPSHAEGVPMSILEAQSLGVAVVATEVGGVPDIVEHGSNGWLVPPRDPPALAAALTRLLDDGALRARLARAGAARACTDYAAESVVARVDRLYAELLNAATPNGSTAPPPHHQADAPRVAQSRQPTAGRFGTHNHYKRRSRGT
jgi:glycosyltransferase involved in cell wall biosynthesis